MSDDDAPIAQRAERRFRGLRSRIHPGAIPRLVRIAGLCLLALALLAGAAWLGAVLWSHRAAITAGIGALILAAGLWNLRLGVALFGLFVLGLTAL